METGLKLLTFAAREAFNYLRLAFIEAWIFRHFDPKYHIYIETNTLGYAIGSVLSQLASATRPNKLITKTNLG